MMSRAVEGLSAGVIAGITIGAVVFVLLILTAFMALVIKKAAMQSTQTTIQKRTGRREAETAQTESRVDPSYRDYSTLEIAALFSQ